MTYLRAEAGKGKSTLLADTALTQLERGDGPLPIFVPLRVLQRGRGVSWFELCATVGVLGAAAESVAAAVKAGLVTLLLDGLDEVAGRYDPSVVQEVLDVVTSSVYDRHSRVVISGRTTEAALLSGKSVIVRSIELPEGEDPAFGDYATLVVGDITPRWPILAQRVPEPPLAARELLNIAPSAREQQTIVD